MAMTGGCSLTRTSIASHQVVRQPALAVRKGFAHSAHLSGSFRVAYVATDAVLPTSTFLAAVFAISTLPVVLRITHRQR